MILFLVLAAIAGAALYAPGIAAPLYLDDPIVLQNAERIIKSRFLGYGSFWLSHKLADLLGFVFPWEVTIYYRIPNILIHVLAATAVVWLARELTQRRLTAGIAGALFLLHPIQTQAVTYISQRFESQAALFMFISAAAFVRFRQGKSRWWVLVTVLAAFAAVASKENAIALPLWLIAIEIVFFSGIPRLKYLAYCVPVVALIVFPAWLTFKSAGGTLIWIPFELYLLSQGAVLLKYLRLVFLPGSQHLLYDFPPAQGVTLAVVGQWALLLLLVGSALYLARRRPVVIFGIVTFFILLSPTSVIPLPDLIFEHRVYPALAGLAIAVAAVFPPTRRTFALFSIVFVFLGYRTFVRNGQWNDRVKFYEAERAAFPQEARILASLGTAYAMTGEVKKAITTNEEARKYINRLNPYYYKPGVIIVDLNLSTLYSQMGDSVRSMEEARRVLSVEPEQLAALRLLFQAQFLSGEYKDARKTLLGIVKQTPLNVEYLRQMREVEKRLGNDAILPVLDAQIAELVVKVPQDSEKLPALEDRRPKHMMVILFVVLVSLMALLTAVFLVLKRSFSEVVRWIRTGSTVSVDSPVPGLQDQ